MHDYEIDSNDTQYNRLYEQYLFTRFKDYS